MVSAALQAQFRLMAALMQSGDAGGFFQDGAARQRLLADQQADLALAHEGGRTGARRGVGEENLHIALAHVAAIDAIDAAGLALDAARDFDRVEIGVGARRLAVGIVDEQRDFGDVAGRAPGAAGEDHIVHLAAAHRGGAGLAHHPAHGIEQVRLAAAIGPDHGGEAGLDEQLRRFDEGFEAGKSKPGELQEKCAALRVMMLAGRQLFFLGELGVEDLCRVGHRARCRPTVASPSTMKVGVPVIDVFLLRLRRDFVDAIVLCLVVDALIDLLRAHAGNPALLDQGAMRIGNARILRTSHLG